MPHEIPRKNTAQEKRLEHQRRREAVAKLKNLKDAIRIRVGEIVLERIKEPMRLDHAVEGELVIESIIDEIKQKTGGNETLAWMELQRQIQGSEINLWSEVSKRLKALRKQNQ